MRFAEHFRLFRLLAPLALLSGCTNPPPTTALPDLAIGVPADFASPGCTDDKSCKAPTAHCDHKSGNCVACVRDDQCSSGQLCAGGACAAGCSLSHGCGDAGVCDNDAGVCRSCMMDSDCGDPKSPRCDAPNRKCVPCLPANDNCASGKYCAVTAGIYACAPGCNNDIDCQGNGNSGDGGVEVGDGGSLDGGVGRPTMACCKHACVDTATDNNNCKVCGSTCVGGRACCGQACVDTTSDANNCGGCGKACILPGGGVPSCGNSQCLIAKCPDGFANCDGNPKSGCNVNTNSDVNNCLGCGNTCVAAHAVSGCAMGCTIAMCNSGFADCDKSVINGCEVDISSTVTDCGACGMACPKVTNGVPGCAMGKCAVASCDGAFADCNGLVNDGCEADTSNDPKDCGACGKVCGAVTHGVPGCSGGVCGIGACTGAFKDCNMNPNDGCEVDSSSDVGNCGACGKSCPGIPNGVAGCSNSACVIGSCNSGFKDCNGNINDGCEVNINTDVKNCNGCGNICPDVPNASPICNNGVCGATGCMPPFKNCSGNPNNGCQTNTSTDVQNCGLCGVACPNVANGTPGCAAGKCGIGVCAMNFKDCNNNPGDGCEINIASDPANCNGCGVKCSVPNATAGCGNGACTVGSCNGGFADCNKNPQDGCEVDILNNLNNCGGCGIVCPGVANGTAACLNGKCGVGSCNGPFRDCNKNPADGCEANITSDPNNCNSCGNACGNGFQCINSACVRPECQSAVQLNDATRNVNAGGAYACDGGIARQWYRFVGGTGSRIPQYVVPINQCGTQAPGWLNGAYPVNVNDSVSRQVCYNWNGNSCQWSNSVQITNCGGYYVFDLSPPPVCNLRYCGIN